MTDYTIYDPSTGAIVKSGSSQSPDISHKLQGDELAIFGEARDYSDAYVDVSAGVIIDRPTADLSAFSSSVTSGDQITLTGLPEGAEVRIIRPEGDDLAALVDATGDMLITFADAGLYTVRVSAEFPFKTSEIDVDVA